MAQSVHQTNALCGGCGTAIASATINQSADVSAFSIDNAVASAISIDIAVLLVALACFLPLQQLDSDCVPPLTLPIAGLYPGVTLSELLMPGNAKGGGQFKRGRLSFRFGQGAGDEGMGTVTVEGNEIVHDLR